MGLLKRKLQVAGLCTLGMFGCEALEESSLDTEEPPTAEVDAAWSTETHSETDAPSESGGDSDTDSPTDSGAGTAVGTGSEPIDGPDVGDVLGAESDEGAGEPTDPEVGDLCGGPSSTLVYDCDLECKGEERYIGNGVCHAGGYYAANMFCETFGFDGGDCFEPLGACETEDGLAGLYDCFTVCREDTTADGFCDVGFDCEEAGYDRGDCEPPVPGEPCTHDGVLGGGVVNCFGLCDPSGTPGDGFGCSRQFDCAEFGFDGGECLSTLEECTRSDGTEGVYDCDKRCHTDTTGDGVCDVAYACYEAGHDRGDCLIPGWSCDPLPGFDYGVSGVVDCMGFCRNDAGLGTSGCDTWFDCAELGWDMGECIGTGDACTHDDGVDGIYDCAESCREDTRGDGVCDTAFNCAEAEFDGDDCGRPTMEFDWSVPGRESGVRVYTTRGLEDGSTEVLCDTHLNWRTAELLADHRAWHMALGYLGGCDGCEYKLDMNGPSRTEIAEACGPGVFDAWTDLAYLDPGERDAIRAARGVHAPVAELVFADSWDPAIDYTWSSYSLEHGRFWEDQRTHFLSLYSATGSASLDKQSFWSTYGWAYIDRGGSMYTVHGHSYGYDSSSEFVPDWFAADRWAVEWSGTHNHTEDPTVTTHVGARVVLERTCHIGWDSPGRVPGSECETALDSSGDFREVYDCRGCCVRESTAELYLGDGTCDKDDTSHIDLRCAAFGFDAGDCTGDTE